MGPDVTLDAAAPARLRGQRPRPPSAKLERFLQLAAQENIRVANVTTAAQYFISSAARRSARQRARSS